MGGMTFKEILEKFEDTFPFADVYDYRPICHELYTCGKQGITVWLKNGDVIEYYPEEKPTEEHITIYKGGEEA